MRRQGEKGDGDGRNRWVIGFVALLLLATAAFVTGVAVERSQGSAEASSATHPAEGSLLHLLAAGAAAAAVARHSA